MPKRVAQHGTTWRYRDHGCRCDACTDAQRVAMADYYERHPEQVEKKRLRMQELRAGISGRAPRARVTVPVPESRLERELRQAREADRR